MTIASIANVRRFRSVALLPFPHSEQVLAWLVIPLALGWFTFALLDSVQNFAPQEIRLSAEGDYDPYFDDFVVFYTAGDLAAGGQGNDLYEPEALRFAQAKELSVPRDSIIQLPFYNPPAFALPLAALSLLPLGIAALAWTATQLAAFALGAGALWRSEGRRSPRIALLLLLAAVSSMPFHETILHGQTSLMFVAAWVALWFGAFERRSDTLVVMALTVFAIKPQLAIVPVVYLLLIGRWRALGFAAAVQGVLGLAAMLVLGPLAHLRWLALLLEATTWEDQNGIWIHAMFGWNAFVRALFGEGQHLLRTVVTLGLGAGTVGYCLLAARRQKSRERQPELFAMLVFLSILISPHLFAQDVILPAAPIALLALRRTGREQGLWLAFGALGWLLTFIHFDVLLGTPDEMGVNFVTLWLAAGVLLSARLLTRGAATAPSTTPETPATRNLAVQLALGAALAFVLLVTVSGFAGDRMAQAIQYSYTNPKGPTYRIVIIGLASE